MVNYNNGKIYKIESHLGDKVYIGSTTKKYLSQRMDTHRKDYKQWKNNKRDTVRSYLLFEEYGIDNCSIVLIELCACESKDELHAREAHYIRTTNCVNNNIPGRTIQEYNETFKDKIKQYREDHKEQKKEQEQKWYEKNKESIAVKTKIYRESNKSKIQGNTQISYDCDCGSCVRVCHKSDHLRTKKHMRYIDSLQKE